VLIDVARRSGCDAVHPGYGFLSERAFFAEAVTAAGLTFIGPSATAIAAMGDKTEARRRMEAAGVPVVPGTTETLETAQSAAVIAERVGYPVLLKAAGGGGGKGMRVIAAASELPRAFAAAANEARAAFGDDRLYLEKFLERPRHIEIQVLADAHGNVVSLGERECSIQRRHQKLIEEAPSPAVTPELRRRMGDAAVAAARAVSYCNAGTIEFLVHGQDFFFLEMNTRIQVEHPVTELVTGIDLVQWQLRVAAGQPLPFSAPDISLSGHAIECRITSEDVFAGFLPSTGRIDALELPSGPGVRWDGGIMTGQEIPLYYDPLLGKLIVHGPDRAAAIGRMRRALDELRIIGIETNASFHRRVLDEPDFLAGRIDIGYIEAHKDLLNPTVDAAAARAAALAAALLEQERRQRRNVPRSDTAAAAGDRWRARGWRG
jgi:acetyl-CoA carboxylase biotin carboxylase subunit